MIAIVGYGSLIRGDDSAGLKAVEKLREKFDEQNLGFFYGYNAVDLLGEFENYNKFIIIDSAFLKKNPGEFIRGNINEINMPDDTSSSHTTNFKVLLNNAKDMRLNIPEIVFYLIEPKNVEIGEELTHEVKEGFDKMIEKISEEIREEIEYKNK